MHACAEHLPEVFKHPDSDVPIPYTELLITATPGYKKRDAGVQLFENHVEARGSPITGYLNSLL